MRVPPVARPHLIHQEKDMDITLCRGTTLSPDAA